jgi:uncharacterized protein (DUF697 family)
MPIPEKEALAGLKLLVVIAKADGSLTSEERTVLAEAVEGAKLGGDVTPQSLLDGNYNVDVLTGDVNSQEGRDVAFSACFAMAYASRECLPEEQTILDRVAKAWAVPKEKQGLLGRILKETRDTAWFTRVEPTADPQRRDAEIRADIVKYSVISAVLGLNPIPVVSIATDVAVVGLQAKMFSDIGRHWGRETSKDTARQVIAGVGVGTGVRLAANGFMKFLPGAGSVFAASTNFASTWALGQVANQYWESGGKADLQMLREVFVKSRVDGTRAYEKHQAEVEAKHKTHEATLRHLSDDYAAGRMTLVEYEKQAAELR